MVEILTTLNVILTGVYAYLTYKIMSANHATVEMMQAQITSSIRPFVYFDLTTHGPLIEGVLKNTGKTAAYNVSIKLAPTIKVQMRECSPDPVLLNAPISFLPPEKEIREFMGSFSELEKGNSELKYSGEISYSDSGHNKFIEQFEIELNSRKGMPYIGTTTTVAELEKMNNKLADLVRAFEKMNSR